MCSVITINVAMITNEEIPRQNSTHICNSWPICSRWGEFRQYVRSSGRKKDIKKWDWHHSVISPQILGRNHDLPKVSVWGKVTFQSASGERVLGRNLNFQIFAWGGSLILDNLQHF